MKTRIAILTVLLASGCATHHRQIGYFTTPNAAADKVMVDDAVNELWPHCTTEDYGTIQFDTVLTGEFMQSLKAGMVQRGCNVLSGPPPAPVGTTDVAFVVDSIDDALERRLTLVARGSTMSRLYAKTDGEWAPVGVWAVGRTTGRR